MLYDVEFPDGEVKEYEEGLRMLQMKANETSAQMLTELERLEQDKLHILQKGPKPIFPKSQYHLHLRDSPFFVTLVLKLRIF